MAARILREVLQPAIATQKVGLTNPVALATCRLLQILRLPLHHVEALHVQSLYAALQNYRHRAHPDATVAIARSLTLYVADYQPPATLVRQFCADVAAAVGPWSQRAQTLEYSQPGTIAYQ